MKKTLIKIFDSLGYQVKFRINKRKTYNIDANEIASLESDLKTFTKKYPNTKGKQIDKEINWSDPAVTRGYLNNSRIALFHEVLNIAKKNNIHFDDKTILDVGSGTGYLLRLINQKFKPKALVGYDSYTELNKVASVICPEMTIFEKDLFSAYESSYDIIFCTETLEHVTRPDEALANMQQYVNPSGYILLTVPDGRKDTYGSHGMYPNKKGYWGHINFWSIESWDIFLKMQFKNKEVITGQVGDFEVIYGIIKM